MLLRGLLKLLENLAYTYLLRDAHLQFCLIGSCLLDQTGNGNQIPHLQSLRGEDNASKLVPRSSQIDSVISSETNSCIILEECRMCFPVIFLSAESEIRIRVCKRQFMMNVLELNGGIVAPINSITLIPSVARLRSAVAITGPSLSP